MDALLRILHVHWPDVRPGTPPGGGNRSVVLDATLNGKRDGARCTRRAAWRVLRDEPQSVVDGDPGAQNLRLSRAVVGIAAWDEFRVDASVLHLADLPVAPESVTLNDRHAAVKTAPTAWEVVSGWPIEPNYVRRMPAAGRAL